jgi:3'-phosphoadenosine 5'-phosphosulfate sulfotransferase (PAPS reductase)/FAD synthetase
MSRFALPDVEVIEAMGAEELLGLVLREFPGTVSLACSFQKEESVLLDRLCRL